MEANPYQSPLVAIPTVEEEQRGRGPRPPGILVLANLHLLCGLGFIAAALFFAIEAATGFSGVEIVTVRENPTPIPYSMAIAASGIYAILGVSIGIGLWRGARWGWWLATVYHFWWALDIMIEIPNSFWEAEWPDQEWLAPLAGTLVRIAVLASITAYFFKDNVRAFFGLQSLRIVPTIAVLVMTSLLLIAATSAVASFPFGGER